MNIDNAIDSAGYGLFHHTLLLLSGVGFAASTIELVLPSLLLPILSVEWGLSSTAGGSLMMGTFAGEVVGGLLWARISDRVSRRAAFLGTALLAAVGATASALCNTFTQLLICRVGLGFALGGSMAIDFVYFLEFVPAARRGSRGTLIILVGILGLFLVGLLGHLVLPLYGWRAFLLACACPSIILSMGRLLWPWDSPRFLYSSGKIKEAEQVVQVMAKWNGREQRICLIDHDNNDHLQKRSTLTDFKHLIPLIIAFGSVFSLHTFAYYGVTTWFSKFAAAHDVSNNVTRATAFMLIAVSEVPGLFLSCWLIDRFGRRIVLAMNLIGAAIAVTSMSFIPKDPSSFLISSCCCYFFIVGVWAGLYVYGPEVFPTAIRSTAFALCGTMGKFGGLVSPMSFGLIWDHVEDPLPFARNIIAICFTLAAIICVFALRETKGNQMN